MKRTICLLLSALLLLALCGCGEQERSETKDIQDGNAVSDIAKQPEASPVTYTKEYSNHSYNH